MYEYTHFFIFNSTTHGKKSTKNSAKGDINIEESFKALIRLVREDRKKAAEKRAKAEQSKQQATTQPAGQSSGKLSVD